MSSPGRRRSDPNPATTARYIATWRRACSRARPSSESTTVTAPTTMPTAAGPSRSRATPHHRRVRAAADLQLGGVLGGERGQARRPAADEERDALTLGRIGQGQRPLGGGRPRLRTLNGRRQGGVDTISHASAIVWTGRRCSRPRSPSHAPAARPRNARPPEARSSAAVWPASSTGCTVNGLRHDGPTRTRSVAAAISSSAGSAGWNHRSLNVVTTSKPPRSAICASTRVLARPLVRLQPKPELPPARCSPQTPCSRQVGAWRGECARSARSA